MSERSSRFPHDVSAGRNVLLVGVLDRWVRAMSERSSRFPHGVSAGRNVLLVGVLGPCDE